MKDFFKMLISIVLQSIFFLIVSYVFISPFNINGLSMQTTLDNGDKVLVSRFMGTMGFYGVGDIVIFRDRSGVVNRNMVKRVIADEYDEIVIEDGRVYVNGVMVDEVYISGNTKGHIDTIVPPGSIYVMGDNREGSYDSREVGSIKKSDVKAKVIAKVFPFSDFKLF